MRFDMIEAFLAKHGNQNTIKTSVTAEQVKILQQFHPLRFGDSGQYMESIWEVFRPPIAQNRRILDYILQLEDLADEFDKSRQNSSLESKEIAIIVIAFQKALTLFRQGIEISNPQQLIQDLQVTIQSIQQNATHDLVPSTGRFQVEFRRLIETFYLKVAVSGPLSQTKADTYDKALVLTNLPTKACLSLASTSRDMPKYKILNYVSHYAFGLLRGHCQENEPHRSFADSLFDKLDRSYQVSLRELDRFKWELLLMGKIVASGGAAHIDEEYDNLDLGLNQFTQTLVEITSQDGNTNNDIPSGQVAELLHRLRHVTNNQGERVYHSMSRGWVIVGLTYLYCYVPSRPFDPLVKRFLSQDFKAFVLEELSSKIRTLEQVGSSFMEQSSTLRSKRMKDKLALLSQVEKPPGDVSQLRLNGDKYDNLQRDFNHIWRIAKSLKERILQEKPLADSVTLQSLLQLYQRLESNYNGFDDIVKPLVGFLGFVVIGLVLEERPHSILSEEKKNNSFLGRILQLQSFSGSISSVATAFLLEILERDVIRHMVESNGPLSNMETVREIFQELYTRWRLEVQKAQKENQANSSLYTFHGHQDDDEEALEQEFLELFPGEGDDHDKAPGKSKSQLDETRQLAIQMSSIHRSLNTSSNLSHSERTQAIYRRIRQLIVERSQPQNGLLLTDCLPKVLLRITDELKELDQHDKSPANYNFYTDSNLHEARNLMALVLEVRRRFIVLANAWPEHATIADVLKLCTEALDLRHGEPLTKLLRKCEKLHEAIYLWQKVASKEYSAAEFYDKLTALIVSWRRLELSTWASLLNFEAQKSLEDAKSWWFVAYENLIYVPQQLSTSEDLSLQHVENAIQILKEFIESTGVGQFSARLDLLRAFSLEVKQRFSNSLVSKLMQDGLVNLLSHYDRFSCLIENFLRKERDKLEKDIKEVVLLASWKDTNIDALRDSAKASHRKLFKVVRKFRKILQQPSSTIVQQGLPDTPNDTAVRHKSASLTCSDVAIDNEAARLCLQVFDDWHSVKARFRNISTTVQTMRTLSANAGPSCDGAAYMDQSLSNIEASMTELREETPKTLTAKNKDLVKHLKVRKRTLFADTLKDLRKMGFQYNLSKTSLLNQDSSVKIFLRSNTIPLKHSDEQLIKADAYFHRILDNMSRVRDISREHTSDLTPAEVTRSVGYLEGLLKCVIEQRVCITDASATFESLKSSVQTLDVIWRNKEHEIRRSTAQSRSYYDEYRKILGHLEPLCLVFADVIASKAELASENHNHISNALQHWSSVVGDSLLELHQLSEFPEYLSHSRHLAGLQSCEKLLEKFNADIEQWTEHDSTLLPILTQLTRFTHVPEVYANGTTMPTELSIIDYRQTVFDSVDVVLAKIQNLEIHQSRLASINSKETPSWLISEINERTIMVKALEIDNIARGIDKCLRNLAELSVTDLSKGIAVLGLLQPVFHQYSNIARSVLDSFSQLHRVTCKFSERLSKIFIKLGTEGFCTPSDAKAGEESGAEKLEGGTGLGDGEGAENIGKDIGEDEDLTELAEQPNDKQDKDDLGSEPDAVDMADADLEGQMDEVAEEKQQGSGDEEEGEDGDVEEETGDVDDLGLSAVDEKMWDSGEKAEKEKEGEDGKGSKSEEQAAAGADQRDNDSDLDGAETPPDEPEAIGQDALEKVDEHLKESENLELPDDMDLDKQSEAGSLDSLVDDIPDNDDDMENEDQKYGEETNREETMSIDGQNDDEDMTEEADGMDQENGSTLDEDENEGSKIGDEADEEDPGATSNIDEGGMNPLPTDAEGITAEDAMDMDHSGGGLDPNDNAPEKEGIGTTSNAQKSLSKGQNGNSSEAAVADEIQDETENKEGVGRVEQSTEAAQNQSLKKLGDILQKWYNQNRPIQDTSDEPKSKDKTQDVDMADVDFEHLPNEKDEGDAQALGAATHDQAKGIDFDNAENQDDNMEAQVFPEELEPQLNAPELQNSAQPTESATEDSGLKGSFINHNGDSKNLDTDDGVEALSDIKDDETEIDISKISITENDVSPLSSEETSRALWTKHESSTKVLSAMLTEQLRLLLAPTLATKLRGDFRTGKRLNIKRIIPYIASSYKRDKIWMRRSIPSKRNYQIMIALDDSQSMADDQENPESTKVELAYQTLALVSKALSVLEVGDLCIVGFGEDVQVAHPFGQPFSNDSGAHVFRTFGFNQEKTDVKRLVHRATEMFKEARSGAHGSAADLWQLLLLISDGICEDHDSIVRLVRQAQEERIMMVFVIMDKNGTSAKAQSIMDLQTAEFRAGQTGEMKLVRSKYMDTFPFKWWLVVRDIKELPVVLSTALRQWFAEVADTER
jgi:midasin